MLNMRGMVVDSSEAQYASPNSNVTSPSKPELELVLEFEEEELEEEETVYWFVIAQSVCAPAVTVTF